MSDEDKKQKLTDIPPLAALCIVTTAIGLIVGMLMGAPIEVTGPLAGLLAALAVYIGQALR